MVKFKTSAIGLFIMIFGLYSQYSNAQENEKICIGEKFIIKSEILGHDREIFVYLPSGYEQSNLTYPVTYVTDGELSFSLTTSLFETFPKGGIIPNSIVVGIPNRGQKERYADFAPIIKDKPESGKADLFIKFFEKELFPYIEKKYRTQPFKIIFGHSFLGMFGSYVFMSHPELFNAYIISSPDLRWIKEDIKNLKTNQLTKPTFIYISKGSEERPSAEIKSFVNQLKTIENLTFSYEENKGEHHQSNGVISTINGLRFIYSGWRLPKPPHRCTKTEIKDHFKKLSQKYGYQIPNPFQNIKTEK